jgi:hypothetical protein
MNKFYRNYLKPNLINLVLIFIINSLLISCGGYKKQTDPNRPQGSKEKAQRNIKEGRGTSIGGLVKGRGGNTTYEFSTSNPLWRASLETLDFLPLSNVDYSGGMIITDWYTDNSSRGNDSIKITLRFLSNDIRSESLKIIVHKKSCSSNQNCKVSLLSKSKIKEELHSTIIRKAALIEENSKNKKK